MCLPPLKSVLLLGILLSPLGSLSEAIDSYILGPHSLQGDLAHAACSISSTEPKTNWKEASCPDDVFTCNTNSISLEESKLGGVPSLQSTTTLHLFGGILLGYPLLKEMRSVRSVPLHSGILLLGLATSSEAIDCWVCGPNAHHGDLPHSTHNISCTGPQSTWKLAQCPPNKVFACLTVVKEVAGPKEVVTRGCGKLGKQVGDDEECEDQIDKTRECHCNKDHCNDKQVHVRHSSGGIPFLHQATLLLGGILMLAVH